MIRWIGILVRFFIIFPITSHMVSIAAFSNKSLFARRVNNQKVNAMLAGDGGGDVDETLDKVDAVENDEKEKEFPNSRQPPPIPPPPPPPPLPAKFPVVNDDDCKTFQRAILVEPKAHCQHTIFAANWDGCICTIRQPGSIALMPNNLQNPWEVKIPRDPDMPAMGSGALPTVPPPSNPLTPYNAPLMVPECPYAKNCEADPETGAMSFDCVGANSWGFTEVRMGKYSPATRFFNDINCFYIMHPYSVFKVPPKIQAFFAA